METEECEKKIPENYIKNKFILYKKYFEFDDKFLSINPADGNDLNDIIKKGRMKIDTVVKDLDTLVENEKQIFEQLKKIKNQLKNKISAIEKKEKQKEKARPQQKAEIKEALKQMNKEKIEIEKTIEEIESFIKCNKFKEAAKKLNIQQDTRTLEAYEKAKKSLEVAKKAVKDITEQLVIAYKIINTTDTTDTTDTTATVDDLRKAVLFVDRVFGEIKFEEFERKVLTYLKNTEHTIIRIKTQGLIKAAAIASAIAVNINQSEINSEVENVFNLPNVIQLTKIAVESAIKADQSKDNDNNIKSDFTRAKADSDNGISAKNLNIAAKAAAKNVASRSGKNQGEAEAIAVSVIDSSLKITNKIDISKLNNCDIVKMSILEAYNSIQRALKIIFSNKWVFEKYSEINKAIDAVKKANDAVKKANDTCIKAETAAKDISIASEAVAEADEAAKNANEAFNSVKLVVSALSLVSNAIKVAKDATKAAENAVNEVNNIADADNEDKANKAAERAVEAIRGIVSAIDAVEEKSNNISPPINTGRSSIVPTVSVPIPSAPDNPPSPSGRRVLVAASPTGNRGPARRVSAGGKPRGGRGGRGGRGARDARR